jgi:hypothetical protein
MTQTSAIAKALLNGQVLSIMTAFKMFSCTNLPRELSRGIEAKFNIQISKVKKDFVSTYGHSGYYFEYRLSHTEKNKEGIEKMKAYVEEQAGAPLPEKAKKVTVREHMRNVAKQEPPIQNTLFNL